MVSKLSATSRPLHPPLTHAPIGAILVTIGGELGGRLGYRAGVGVRARATAPAPRSR